MKHTFLRALCLLCALLMLGSLALTGCGETAEEEAAKEESAEDTTAKAPEATQPSDSTLPEDTKKAHDHDLPSNMSLKYVDNEDGSVSIVIKDCEGNLLIDQKVLNKEPIKEYPAEEIVCLSWVTDKNSPEGYECLYINRLTCQVSGLIKGIQTHDNKHVVYAEVQDSKLSIIARDLFYDGGYYEEIPVEDAYLDGISTIKGAVKEMDSKKNVKAFKVIYYKNAEGKEGVIRIDLTEKDKTEKDETKTTKKPESTKTTKKTDKK